MRRISGSKFAVLVAACSSVLAAAVHAGVTTSFVSDGPSLEGTPTINTAGTAASTINTTFSVSIGFAPGDTSRFGQSFTTTTSFVLDKVELYVGGGVSNGMGIHLYTGFAGGGETDTFINPNNPTATDLLGGGSGLSFNLNCPTGYMVFDLTGSDEITLAANTKYYFEVSGGDAGVFFRRAGSSPYSGGNAYLGSDPSNFRGLPNSGGVRDMAMGVYASSVAPGSSVWTGSNNSLSGDYFNTANWGNGTVPNAAGSTAVFNSSIATGTRIVYAESAITLANLQFDSLNTYQLAGVSLTFSNTSTGSLLVKRGTPKINLPTIFASNTTITTQSGASLLFANPVTLNSGVTVTAGGTGVTTFQSALSATGPATLKLVTGATVNLDLANVSPNITVNVDPATLNIGGNQTLGGLVLHLGGNTVNVGKNSSGGTTAASLSAPTMSVTSGTGNVLNTVTAANSASFNTVSIDSVSGLIKTGPGTLSAGVITGGGSLAVNGGKVSLPAASHTVSTLGALTVANDGGSLGSRTYSAKIDVGSSDIIVRNGSLSNLTDMARAAQSNNGGDLFGGNGLTSSVAAADASGNLRYAVGVIQNSIDGSTIYDTFGGVAVSGTDVLVKFTYFGDADLNGLVDDTDFFLTNNGYLNSLSGWLNGDFDYSGAVDDTDFFLLNNGYLNQGAGLRAGGSVPEPTGMGLIGLGAMSLLGRRRK
jgi:PEP-CTERM motif